MNGYFCVFIIMELVTFQVLPEPNFYCDRIFKLVPRWEKCISVLGGIY